MAERPDIEEHHANRAYKHGNAYDIVAGFEQRVAEFTGARYAIAVDRCTHALFLCFLRCKVGEVVVPARTYHSVALYVQHAGGTVRFEDYQWVGAYRLHPYPIWDAAKRFSRGMFADMRSRTQPGPVFAALSFHIKKSLPIGTGGMILTDDADAADWFRQMRYDGRTGVAYRDERPTLAGWHFYMTPEQAARGLALMDVMPINGFPDLLEDYPDLREMPVFADAKKGEAA